jgi:hypothetical protein
MAENLPAVPKPQIMAGGQVAALIPQSLDEAFRVSQAIAISGLAPKGIDKAEQIMVAIMAGAELGLAPFQSLQSFAVVNGRPTLWGDGLLAVVRGRGVKVREWLEGEGDAMVAHCECTRPDNGEQIYRTFTVGDAKKAGLWGKSGPWQQYPKRMLQMRARALSLRDGCADMLRGIQVREEVDDYQPVRNVTPQASGLAARLAAGKATATEGFTAATAEQAPHDPQTGEVIEESVQDAHFVENAEAIAADGAADLVKDDAAEDDEFPGDRARGPDDFDAPAWAAETNQALAGFASLADLNAFTDDTANIARFEALETASPGLAKSLAAAITGRRKALASKEQG